MGVQGAFQDAVSRKHVCWSWLGKGGTGTRDRLSPQVFIGGPLHILSSPWHEGYGSRAAYNAALNLFRRQWDKTHRTILGNKTYSRDEIICTLRTRYVAQRAGLLEFEGGRESSLQGVQEGPCGEGELVGKEHGWRSLSTSKGPDA